jgi:hypothetical protein
MIESATPQLIAVASEIFVSAVSTRESIVSLYSLPPLKNARCEPSGEKAGEVAPSVCGNGPASPVSRLRISSAVVAPWRA